MFSVEHKMSAIINNTNNVHRFYTRIYDCNFSMHKIAAYTLCTQTYFKKKEKNKHANFQLLKP